MSRALQRVVVRMLHDPGFADAVIAGAAVPELSEGERSLLLGLDRRAFRTDPYRRGRLLTALLDEYPAAAAIASDGGRQLSTLDAFFSAAAFHEAIQQRRHLALAFGEWLLPQAPGVAALELALARARRDPARVAGDRWLQRARGLVPVAVPVGSLARWQALRERLGAAPADALAAGRVRTRDLPVLGHGREHWLVEVGPDGAAGLGGSSEALHGLLDAAAGPTPRDVLVAVAADLGAGDEAAEIVAGFVEEGLLVPVS